MNRSNLAWMLIAGALTLPACNSTTVRTTQQTPAAAVEAMPESQLLDVGVGIFDPGVDGLKEDEDNRTVFPEVRKAEARYMPNILATTLQNTGNWGVVRVVPLRQSEMDVWVDATIRESTGEVLKLDVTVQDSSGRTWYTRSYEEHASKYAYDQDMRRAGEPFQGMYNRIANDMITQRKQMSPTEATRLRTITELKFAERFAPDAFAGYLEKDGKGRLQLVRLPADNDPLLQRIRRIRERDNQFVDTLQEHYTAFGGQMKEPYHQWRRESYVETKQLEEIEAQSRARMIGGALAVLGGLAAIFAGAESSSAGTRATLPALGAVGIGAGAMVFKSGLDKRSEAKLHVESLRELALSLDADIQPHTVTLEDRTVTITGTVEQQYAQWRQILRDIYVRETGVVPADAPATTP